MNHLEDQGPRSSNRGSEGERLYAGALSRIQRAMAVLGVAAPVITWLWLGWRMALGLALGCAIAYVNFLWLARGVGRMAERIVGGADPQSGTGIVSRFLLRYVLMGLGAYVILSVSPASLYGLLAGLFLPVAAIACEAAYEAWVALAHGI